MTGSDREWEGVNCIIGGREMELALLGIVLILVLQFLNSTKKCITGKLLFLTVGGYQVPSEEISGIGDFFMFQDIL